MISQFTKAFLLFTFLISVLAVANAANAQTRPNPSRPVLSRETVGKLKLIKSRYLTKRQEAPRNRPRARALEGKLTVLDENNRPISNNPSRSSGYIPMGVAFQNGQEVRRTFTLRNDGSAPLTISKIENLAAASSSKIDLVLTGKLANMPATIAAGESQQFQAKAQANSDQTPRSTVSINIGTGSTVEPGAPPLLGLSFNSEGRAILTISGDALARYTIQGSPDLVTWQDLGTISLDYTGKGVFIDPSAPDSSHKFFRTQSLLTATSGDVFQFNLAATVPSSPILVCPSDSNNSVPAGFSCDGKSNGTICGSASNGKTKVCNHNSCVLMGDMNNDGDITMGDMDAFFSEINSARKNLAANFTCDGTFSNPIDDVQGFADALASASNAEYNTRVRELCGGATLKSTRGKGLVFIDGPMDFEAMKSSAGASGLTQDTPPIYKAPTEVCIDNLGTYDRETGEMLTGSDGYLTGKYAKTAVLAIEGRWDNKPTRFRASDGNNFSVNFRGDSSVPARKAIVASGEVQTYYDINKFRSTLFNEAFIRELNLPEETEKNLVYRQIRSDLNIPGLGGMKSDDVPIIQAFEATNPAGIQLYPPDNGMRVWINNKLEAANPIASMAFDSEAFLGDYAGLLGFWVLGSNAGFPPDNFYGGDPSWNSKTANVLSPLSNALSAWVGYRVGGNSEVYKSLGYSLRIWGNRPCGGTGVPCDKGQNIRNIMMFDEGDNSKSGVFPFYFAPAGLTNLDGPVSSDIAALFIAAVFYDIAHEAGLGLHKTDLIVWKTLSLITDGENFTMRSLGQKIQEATHELWSDGRYDQDIADILTSRGIPVNGVDDFRKNLPPAIGKFPESLERDIPNGFGSAHPEAQPGPSFYGSHNTSRNGYKNSEDADYYAYQFYRFSKYGPCDKLALTDGTFTTGTSEPYAWKYNQDGKYYVEIENRDLGNLVLLAPGKTIRWIRSRQRCPNESTGFYAEDVRPFGFRVTQSTPNGFSFTPRLIEGTATAKTYEMKIVDPSLTSLGSAEYQWLITHSDGKTDILSGLTVKATLSTDEPVSIKITRNRGGKIDTLSIRDRGNDLDRKENKAFVIDVR